MKKLPRQAETTLPVLLPSGSRILTAQEFQGLADVPPEAEWFANIDNAGTRRIYATSLREFMTFAGIADAADFRIVNRSHIIAWRKDLETRGLAGATMRSKLAALSSLFDHLCEANAVTHNPVKGVKRPKVETYEGKTPALGDHQARALLEELADNTLKGKRDRAILSVLLFRAFQREELCKLKVKDISERRGTMHHRLVERFKFPTRTYHFLKSVESIFRIRAPDYSCIRHSS